MTSPDLHTVDTVESAVARAAERLFARQRDDGSWVDALPSSAVSTGAAIAALHAADPVTHTARVRDGAEWLRGDQQPDGGWGDTPRGPSGLNATAIALGALAFASPHESAEAIAAGRDWLARHGGPDAVADRERCSMSTVCLHLLAAGGLVDEQGLARIPVELILLPRRLRQKLSFTMPGLLAWGVMQGRRRRFGPLQRVGHRLSEPRALAWLDGVQAYEGYAGGFEESPLMAAIVAFGLVRGGVGDTIAARCLAYLDATGRDDGSWPINRDLEFSASMFVTHGLQASGYREDPRLRSTVAWVRACQVGTPFFPTGCPPGGWGWSRPSGWPNTDDTSSALLTLAGAGVDGADPQLQRGAAWLRAMQNRDGSWACFVRGGTLSLDRPCAVMTAHALMALHHGGAPADDPALRRGLDALAGAQRPDGSLQGLWYREATAGTARTLEAYAELGHPDAVPARRCRGWLRAHRNTDGGWGGGDGEPSTAEETAWALSALLAADRAGDRDLVEAAVGWLLDAQQPDGLWEPALVGVYFSDLVYHDDLIAAGYVLQALGRALPGRAPAAGGPRGA